MSGNVLSFVGIFLCVYDCICKYFSKYRPNIEYKYIPLYDFSIKLQIQIQKNLYLNTVTNTNTYLPLILVSRGLPFQGTLFVSQLYFRHRRLRVGCHIFRANNDTAASTRFIHLCTTDNNGSCDGTRTRTRTRTYTHYITHRHTLYHKKLPLYKRCDGRVVKALDSKSNGIFPRRFEPCSQRIFSLFV